MTNFFNWLDNTGSTGCAIALAVAAVIAFVVWVRVRWTGTGDYMTRRAILGA